MRRRVHRLQLCFGGVSSRDAYASAHREQQPLLHASIHASLRVAFPSRTAEQRGNVAHKFPLVTIRDFAAAWKSRGALPWATARGYERHCSASSLNQQHPAQAAPTRNCPNSGDSGDYGDNGDTGNGKWGTMRLRHVSVETRTTVDNEVPLSEPLPQKLVIYATDTRGLLRVIRVHWIEVFHHPRVVHQSDGCTRLLKCQ